MCFIFDYESLLYFKIQLILLNLLTVCSKQMFSLREPTQPQNVMKNIRIPTTISNRAGSIVRQANAVSAYRNISNTEIL